MFRHPICAGRGVRRNYGLHHHYELGCETCKQWRVAHFLKRKILASFARFLLRSFSLALSSATGCWCVRVNNRRRRRRSFNFALKQCPQAPNTRDTQYTDIQHAVGPSRAASQLGTEKQHVSLLRHPSISSTQVRGVFLLCFPRHYKYAFHVVKLNSREG